VALGRGDGGGQLVHVHAAAAGEPTKHDGDQGRFPV
jgi:hypothetical protein